MDSAVQEAGEELEPLNPNGASSSPNSLPLTTAASGACRFEVERVPVTPHRDSPDTPEADGSPTRGQRFSIVDIESPSSPHTPPDSSHLAIHVTDTTKPNGENSSLSKDHLPLADNEESQFENHMALYEDDLHHQGRISTILSRINAYQGGMQPSMRDVEKSGSQQKKKATLGTLLGVYLPCIQNIFGILLFVRMTWVVGMAGAVEAFFIVGICCCTTLLTSISMSAIATNGVVPAGGSYFMISRSLGPEFGGAVGVLFYLGTSVATSMYIIGAVEILVVYMAPTLNRFGDTNSFRLYGTIVLLLLAIIVFIGVAFVSKFAAISLACVTLSILCIYIGIFIANEDSSVEVCLLGDRLLTLDSVTLNGTMMCTKNVTGPIHNHYCTLLNATTETYQCDSYFNDHETRLLRAIPGLPSGVFSKNAMNRYTQQGNIVGTDMRGDVSRGEIVADITTSFMILLGIYFPSCTGIMAGSNRSGDLADAQKSIPVGTILAIITTSSVYLSSVLFFAGTVEGDLLRDKYGESIGGSLLIGKLAWPHEWVIRIGAFLSTLGAGLQSLTGAPRLLQAIAQDGVIPFLSVFSVTTKRGEPFRALVLTVFIAFIGVCIGVLDYVAPIITMFFLMCYGFVNMACALQTLLRTPNWRPRFRFYHWTLSLIGLALCITLMFISSWYYALAAIAIACCIYKYIEYKGAEQEWGDGIRGLAMSAARYSLLRLQEGPPHTKNWRPQLLVLMKLDASLQPKYPRMVQFANQLKAGKGLTLVCSVLEGKFQERSADALAAKQSLSKMVKEMNIKGFSDVSVASDVTEGICSLVQNAGLGGLRHNTVVMGWPYGWRHSEDDQSYRVFLETVRNVSVGGLALLVTKGINQFPEPDVKLRGTIDVWWIVHDGGLLMLLPFLLTREKPWKHCRLRIFTVAQMEDNSITMKKDLELYLYQLRIAAEVDVIEMSGQDISAYTYERTLMMEQRTQMLRTMRVRKPEPQSIVDRAHHGGAGGAGDQASPQKVYVQLDTVPEESSTDPETPSQEHFTFTPAVAQKLSKNLANVNNKPDKKNVRRMHTAVRLNEHIVEKSHDAQLVILNLPAPPKSGAGDENYMEFLEVLTEGIERVVMVRGSGREVITIYS